MSLAYRGPSTQYTLLVSLFLCFFPRLHSGSKIINTVDVLVVGADEAPLMALLYFCSRTSVPYFPVVSFLFGLWVGVSCDTFSRGWSSRKYCTVVGVPGVGVGVFPRFPVSGVDVLVVGAGAGHLNKYH
jgi:hypothetical protein